MKIIMQVHKEGKYYVATDLITNVADQWGNRAEAVANLKKGLEEHCDILRTLKGAASNENMYFT